MLIHLDIKFPKMPCSWMTLDAMDVSGDVHLEVDHEVLKQRLDSFGRVKHEHGPELHEFGPKIKEPVNIKPKMEGGCGDCYGAQTEENPCCNSCKEVREAYKKKNWALRNAASVEQCKNEGYRDDVDDQRGEGCHVYGDMKINKVAGNIHFAPGHSFQQGAMHLHDLAPFAGEKPFDFSHEINKLAFGLEYPGLRNPLDGHKVKQKSPSFTKLENDVPAGGTFQYFLKVVPTKYTTTGNSTIYSNQYSVTEMYKEPVPGIMQQLPVRFFYFREYVQLVLYCFDF
jgi:hypothetical protein